MKNISKETLMQSIEDSSTCSNDARQILKAQRLKDLVAYAKVNSDYFDQLYTNIPEDFKLTDLPITSKKQLMPHFEKWVTNPEITQKKLDDYFSDLEHIGEPFLEKFAVLTTSGTTGQPLWMVRDQFHANVHGAMMKIRLFDAFGVAQWMDVSKYKLASVLGTGGFHSAVSSFERMKKASPNPENFLLCSILDSIPKIVQELNAFNPDTMTGYPSVLAVLAKEKLEGRLTIQPKFIACSAEQLTDYALKMMQDAFQCPILNSFCSTEGGEVAFNCPCGNMHLNDDWVIIEPVDVNDQPSKKGEMSAGILLTNLAGGLQPIIRYKVEDSVIIEDSQCRCGSTLPILKVIGRNGDNLSFEIPGGTRTIAPVMLEFLITKTDGIVQFQFVQKSSQLLELRAVYDLGCDPDCVNDNITQHVQALFRDNDITGVVFTISDLPPMPSKGGKIKAVTIEMN